MPEAPEVQTVLKTLETQIKDVLIEDVFVYYPKIIDNVDIDVFKNHVIGQSFRSFDRIGKYLIFGLDDYDLVVHLRMEGKFYLYDKLQNDKHIHVVFKLNNQTFMSYHDTRKFGRMYLYPKKEDIHSYACFKNVGYDYMDEKVNGMYFYNCIHSLKRNLKSCLLDQSIMAGVGNIYADEICFASGLDPRSRACKLSKKDCDKIVYETKRILQGATRFGGTTIRSYTSSLGVTGRFQLYLKVHDQTQCKVCHHTIKKLIVSQRGTYLCPNCQKRK
ncbi:bifunctional DNA-formamidopyrimidine glycosylase/DNA-(apurinic or apyrimidinic site) lyase [uncultured Holdemanella sp.]|uniref:bifunctional DNA-formamidopyrimidine glycosylase/DNA-(apurinic or apyrimidinic site) lyase n=1 Tax=uncultured Holdemanella sp. TaxID=1763549 RepID=UPI0025F69833|nr:bifunctional DNA-formamidopyrimidine glycosylase/DNA-(apurinic or apyrimidinic site) lyase [uncultured Holdemanella sp.]